MVDLERRAHLQHVATATAINLARLADWLPEADRLVAKARFADGRSIKDLAVMLGVDRKHLERRLGRLSRRVLTPEFVGQRCLDTVGRSFYVALGTTSADWMLEASPALGTAALLLMVLFTGMTALQTCISLVTGNPGQPTHTTSLSRLMRPPAQSRSKGCSGWETILARKAASTRRRGLPSPARCLLSLI